MSEAASNRAVRKALLQAHAEIERIEVAQRVAQLREAVTPGALLQQVLPGRLFGQGRSVGRALSIPQVFSMIGNVYDRYPMLWSTATSLFIGRGRVRRVVKVLGLVLAARKALQMASSGRRRVR